MHEWVLWVALAVSVLHVFEEHSGDWVRWARVALKLDVDWATFYLTNGGMFVVLLAGAMIGWNSPEIALMGPALLGINAIFFHIVISIVQRRWSPGTFTATVLYLPVAVWAYWAADKDGVLSGTVVGVSLIGGALLMAFPVVLLKLHARAAART